MTRLIAYLLLIAFGVLLTPRELLHECDHNHDSVIAHHDIQGHDEDHEHSNSNQDDSNLSFEDNCFACDYDMDVSDKPLSFNARFTKQSHPKLNTTASAIIFFDNCDKKSLRGPPYA